MLLCSFIKQSVCNSCYSCSESLPVMGVFLHPTHIAPSTSSSKVSGQMDKQHVFTHRHDTVKHVSVLALAGVFMTLIHCLLFIITYVAFIISWPLTSRWYMDPPLNFNFRNVWLFLPGPCKRTSFMVLSQWWINTRPVNEWAS